jgi:putative nucleotidyltransferase with HDIG domain
MQPTTFLQITGHKYLPTLPGILIQLMQACKKNRNDVSALSKIIKKDPALSLKIISLACSERFQPQPHSISVAQAVQQLGGEAVRHIAQWASAKEVFNPFRCCSRQEFVEFWLHALRTAYLAELISRDIRYPDPESAFQAGLFHDIGKLFLLMNYPVKYRSLFNGLSNHSDPPISEKEIVGFTHFEIGAQVVRQRIHNAFMADAIYFHHFPPKKIVCAFPLVQIVFAANHLAKTGHQNHSDALKIINMLFHYDENLMEELMDLANIKVQEALVSLEMEIVPPVPRSADPDGSADNQNRLAGEISDCAVSTGMMHRFLAAQDEKDILYIARQSLQILLEINPIYFFRYDSNRRILVSHCMTGDNDAPDADTLTLPDEADNNLLAASLHQKKMLDSFSVSIDADLKLCDLQLINLIGKEGIVVVPLLFGDQHVGVVAIGINKTEYQLITKRKKQIQLIVDQTAAILYTLRSRRELFETDLTQRLEASQARWQKVVHEVNNPLNIIKNYLKIFEMRLAEKDIAADEIKIIRTEINRIGNTLTHGSAKKNETVRARPPVDINSLVLDLARLVQGSLEQDSGMEIHLDLDEALPTVMLDEDLIKQVILNLLKNAVEALPRGGNITIKTMGRNGDSGTIGPTGANETRISISDDGPGIPDEIKAGLFQPFSTSKKGHEGLGLSIVDNLVKQLNGSITCESSQSTGTRFTIGLPES